MPEQQSFFGHAEELTVHLREQIARIERVAEVIVGSWPASEAAVAPPAANSLAAMHIERLRTLGDRLTQLASRLEELVGAKNTVAEVGSSAPRQRW